MASSVISIKIMIDPITEADGISTFTQQDLVAGRLAYHHDGSQELSDWFNVTARARERSTGQGSNTIRREVHLDVGASVKIYLESHQRPPTVLSKEPVVVEEGHNGSISKQHLEVYFQISFFFFFFKSPQMCTFFFFYR